MKVNELIIGIEKHKEEPVSEVWHDSNKEQPEYGSDVVVLQGYGGDVLHRVVKVNPDRIWAYTNDLLNLTLPDSSEREKEPVSEDLKTELNKYIKDHFTVDKEQLDRFGIEEKDYMYSMDKSDMLALVEHFTNWQKTKEELACEDLENAATKYAQDKYMPVQTSQAFKAGAQWQKTKDESTTEDLGEYINELSKQFPEVSFAKLSRIAVRVARWQRNQDVKNKLPKVISRTDLDEYAYQCAYDMSNDWAIENPTWKDVEDACKLGAKWQKEQFEKDYTDLRNGIATAKGIAVTMAYDKGMADAREQMMANAVDGVVHHFEKCKVACVYYNDPTGVPMAYFTSPEGLSAGDKVKIIVIKK